MLVGRFVSLIGSDGHTQDGYDLRSVMGISIPPLHRHGMKKSPNVKRARSKPSMNHEWCTGHDPSHQLVARIACKTDRLQELTSGISTDTPQAAQREAAPVALPRCKYTLIRMRGEAEEKENGRHGV